MSIERPRVNRVKRDFVLSTYSSRFVYKCTKSPKVVKTKFKLFFKVNIAIFTKKDTSNLKILLVTISDLDFSFEVRV